MLVLSLLAMCLSSTLMKIKFLALCEISSLDLSDYLVQEDVELSTAQVVHLSTCSIREIELEWNSMRFAYFTVQFFWCFHHFDHLNLGQEVFLHAAWLFEDEDVVEDFSETCEAFEERDVRVEPEQGQIEVPPRHIFFFD